MLLLTKRCLLQSLGIKSGQLGTDGKLLLSMPYHQCDQIRQNNVDFKSIWPFLRVYLAISKILNLHWQFFMLLGHTALPCTST